MSGSGDEEPSAAGGLLYQENDAPCLVTVQKTETDVGKSRCINSTDGDRGGYFPETVEDETDGGKSRCINATDGGSGGPFPVTVSNETVGKSRCFDATDGDSGSGSDIMFDTVVASPIPTTGTPGSTCDCRQGTVAPRDSANRPTIHMAAQSSGHGVASPTIDVAAQSSGNGVDSRGGEREREAGGGRGEGAGNGGGVVDVCTVGELYPWGNVYGVTGRVEQLRLGFVRQQVRTAF